MLRRPGIVMFTAMALLLCSCAKKENTEQAKTNAEAPKPAGETPAAGLPEGPGGNGPRAVVHLKSGRTVGGTIVASTQTEMVVAGDDNVESKIPLDQVKSVDYASAEPAKGTGSRASSVPPSEPAGQRTAETKERSRPPAATDEPSASGRSASTATEAPRPAPEPVTTRTYEVPAGSQISVRTNETIDSSTATEGQTFDAQVTRAVTDARGDVVIPRGARARVVIRSASQGGRIRGASDLVIDLASVTINGKRYALDTTDLTRKGKAGVGANKRTATYTGGGAALGAIIGAIAGGGKGAAIGAGAGAGAGALTQIFTRGKAIKVPVESVLTFRLDRPLHVTEAE